MSWADADGSLGDCVRRGAPRMIEDGDDVVVVVIDGVRGD